MIDVANYPVGTILALLEHQASLSLAAQCPSLEPPRLVAQCPDLFPDMMLKQSTEKIKLMSKYSGNATVIVIFHTFRM